MRNILIVGAGAIGTTVAAWLAKTNINVSVFDLPNIVDKVNRTGLEIYHENSPNQVNRLEVNAYSNLDNVPKPDMIVLCVKNYSLDTLSKIIQEKFGSDRLVVGLQNGIENQSILPKYFNKVIYGVVCYNAWVDGPARVGYQKKGPIVLGHKGSVTDQEILAVAGVLGAGVETNLQPDLTDAAHAKIIINLTNSLTTLVALHQNDQSRSKHFQKLLTTMTYEGVKVMEAAGFKESKLGGMPSWLLIKAAGCLPWYLTRKPYLKNLKKLVISSMAQDIILNGASVSELESINGYVLRLAKEHNVAVPVNQAVYELCKKEFGKKPFEPMTVRDIWTEVKWNAA